MIDDFRGPAKKPKRERAKLDSAGRRNFVSPGNAHRPPGTLPEPGRFNAAPVRLESRPASETPFKTPDQVSQEDSRQKLLNPAEHQELLPEHAGNDDKKGLFGFLRKRPTKKQAIVLSVAALLAIGSGGALALFNRSEPPEPVAAPAKVTPKPKPKPKPILSPLTGMAVTPEQQARPVTGIMIENSSEARPQSGLKDAGIVFEAIAESGVTRFLALFQESAPGSVGPVRSARPYYLDWTMAFDANYAHVGGSPDALQRIKDIGVRDLDQFFNSAAYWRIPQRFAPHNMYTGLDKLNERAAQKGYGASTFTPLARKDKEQPAKTPTARSIDFAISGAFYNSHYDYDAASNSYKRVMGGKPHTDNETGAQLASKVVVALAMPYGVMEDGYHSTYETVGSGSMLVFQDGTVTPGTWSKADPKAQFEFKDAANAVIKLNPGQTWFTVLSDISKATYAP